MLGATGVATRGREYAKKKKKSRQRAAAKPGRVGLNLRHMNRRKLSYVAYYKVGF